MSNSYFIALTLGMAAVTFSHPFLVYRPGRQDPDVRAGDQNATLRAGHRSAGHHHHSDPEREFPAWSFDLKKSEGDRRHHLHARQLPFRPGVRVVVSGVGLAGVVKLFLCNRLKDKPYDYYHR